MLFEDHIAQSRSSVQRSRAWSPSTGAGTLRSNGARDRTVEASSPSSTTEADEAQSLWQSVSGAAGRGFFTDRLRIRGAAAAAALGAPRGPLEDSTVELELHVGAAGGGATRPPPQPPWWREGSGRREEAQGKLVLASGPRRVRAATS